MTAPSVPTARAAADLRLLRAAVFTAVCVTLSAAGHMAASFAAVRLWTLGLAAVAVFAVAAPLAGRERSLPGIAAGLAVGQLALHALFAMGQHPMPVLPARPAGLSDQAAVALARHLTCGLGGVRMDAGTARQLLGPGGADLAMDAGLTGAGGHPGGMPMMAHCLAPSLPMLLGHLLAALGLGWLLRRGEAALWRLVRLSAPAAGELAARARVGAVRRSLTLLRALLAGLGAAQEEGRRAPAAYGDETAPREPALHHSVIRRGPPAYGRPALALAA
ncbi:hypothetical protein ADL22_14985 [Streptomyces sp. NRRL F-4489]|uniref:hypothetical protein n=1 Tax=Streptomyces sp. NRRL F-4489 TaxID=1609095 RepID=UPI00074674F7|nr:hypothetical protein [Streptomyces sp. NRRL F-4489]KUL40428.1 hypothetical protein ADL22_14985 [Streptomyces sp. NRRL F-4489]